ncbi:MAG: DUF1624 domain-containing protein [Clostridiales bacterium]|nr:DUF1624 domain-containing protein [Clostridiales bacterium]
MDADKQRIWEIDALRGLAIVLMIFFHLLVDLNDFFAYPVPYYALPWMAVGKASAILFMLISGVSCSLSRSNIRRGVKVFLYGMVVTVATYFFVRELYIRFGILHFLGSAMVIWGALDRMIRPDRVKRAILYLCSPVLIVLGYFFNQMRVESPYLYPLGLMAPGFATYDYYPLIPWLGVFFAGVAIGKLCYSRGSRAGDAGRLPQPAAGMVRCLTAMGRRSLFIYIVHQPVLLAILYLLLVLPGVLLR